MSPYMSNVSTTFDLLVLWSAERKSDEEKGGRNQEARLSWYFQSREEGLAPLIVHSVHCS